ncbi:MAG TPA: lipoyl(octanoyl) transferase LipB [Spongiibacteraceae bacterium]|nr:lipoyl(octanoyl) transferase LipB [Spongiibacteraceae bacterium]
MAELWWRRLGTVDYLPVWHAMQAYTDRRDERSPDEIWFLQHPPVFTQGQAGRAEHLLATGDIPVVQVDRGGQVTYHGPGQLVGYLLVDLRRLGIGVRDLVRGIERAIVALLAQYELPARPRPDAPGVYLASGAKIAQLGLRVRRGCTFHGLSLNINMDLEPFHRINPCGLPGLEVARLCDSVSPLPAWDVLEQQLIVSLCAELGYTDGVARTLHALPDELL